MICIYNLLLSVFLTYAIPAPKQSCIELSECGNRVPGREYFLTLPDDKFFVTNATSIVPLGPVPTSHTDVSSWSRQVFRLSAS